MKTAKVVEVGQIKPWNGPKGTIYFHQIVLDNGDQGEIGKKHENGIKIGDELTYEIESGQYGNKIKAVQPAFNGSRGGGQQRGSSASFALSYAKDLMIASMPFHQDIKTADWVKATVSAANQFHTWLKENE